MNETKLNLAQRCFEYAIAEDELLEKIHNILSNKSFNGCCDENFQWFVDDYSTDLYDQSVEVIMNFKAPPMTREQADKILDLGFGCIYESQGERGTQWCKNSSGKCSPRNADDDSRDLSRARARINTQIKEISRLQNAVYLGYDDIKRLAQSSENKFKVIEQLKDILKEIKQCIDDGDVQSAKKILDRTIKNLNCPYRLLDVDYVEIGPISHDPLCGL